MAEKEYAKSTTSGGDLVVYWSAVTESDTFQAFDLGGVVAEISVHVYGTFGGATVTIKGGNKTGQVTTLQQIGGTDAAPTAEDIFSILDRPQFIQPTASGGTGQSVSVYMLVKR